MIVRILLPLKLAAVFALLAGLVLLSRPAAQTNNPAAIRSLLGNAKVVADVAGNPTFEVDSEPVDGDALIRFYTMRNSRLTWSGGPRAPTDAAIAIRALSNAGEHGLDTAPYHLGRLMDSGRASGTRDATTRDLLLTDALLKYARHLRNGSPAADRSVDLPAQDFDAVTTLSTALEGGTLAEFLRGLEPPHPEYKRLLAALSQYRKLADEGGWPQLPRSPAAHQLQQRLAYEDTMAIPGSNVLEALRRFQQRNGLEPDGKLGPQTLALLNTPASTRVHQIEANMERWRWLPRDLEMRRVMVNAADATLEVIDKDQVILRSRVIVGAARSPTPMFRAVATGITVNPPWNVPASIARNEFLPRLRNNPNFLRSHNIVLLNGPADDPFGTRIDWKGISAETFPYRLQQRPGAGNALGQLKLEMPNAFSVYLHDTPGKQDFTLPERDLSHGCVRVEKILPLASLALGGDVGEAVKMLASVAATRETKLLPMEQALPVYVLYWTAIANPDGTVQFRRDVYGRDERLISARRAGSIGSVAFFTGDCTSSAG